MACFADDPVAFFTREGLFAHHLPHDLLEELQIEALRDRFAAMRDALPPLRALADAGRVREIRRIEDVAPLMFPHSLFKSYAHYLLDDLAFPELTEWLSRLTLVDLSAVKGRSFDAIDHWMDALDAETDLSIVTSSGTTEALSLLPRGKRESAMFAARFMVDWQQPGASSPVKQVVHDRSMVWLSFELGRAGMMRSAAQLRENYTTATTRFLALMPGASSTDWQHYVARCLAAHKYGTPPPEPTDYVRQQEAEQAEIHRNYDNHVRSLLEMIRDQLRGSPVHLVGGLPMVYKFAKAGLEMGMEPGLAPGSRVTTGGGLKGFDAPPDMEPTIKRFAGVEKLYEGYGMTELGDAFAVCEEGRFHIWPWVVALLIDEQSGALLPRRGKQRGRAAFFDLSAQTYWGGIVTADRISIDWDTCPCGRTSPQAIGPIARIQEEPDEHVFAGATATAAHMALEALNAGL